MSSEENKMGGNYMTLKPNDASVGDLCRLILPSGSKKIRKVIDFPDGEEKTYSSFYARWLIFITILVLKFLITILTLLNLILKFVLIIKNFFVNFKGMYYTSSLNHNSPVISHFFYKIYVCVQKSLWQRLNILLRGIRVRGCWIKW